MDINEIALTLTLKAIDKIAYKREDLKSEEIHLIYAEIYNDILTKIQNGN